MLLVELYWPQVQVGPVLLLQEAQEGPGDQVLQQKARYWWYSVHPAPEAKVCSASVGAARAVLTEDLVVEVTAALLMLTAVRSC